MTVAAAWYPDPVHPAKLRWWDGHAWTDFVWDAPPAVREQSVHTTHSAGFVVRAAAVRQAQGISLTGGPHQEADATPHRPQGTPLQTLSPSGSAGVSTPYTQPTTAGNGMTEGVPLTRRAMREAQRRASGPAAEQPTDPVTNHSAPPVDPVTGHSTQTAHPVTDYSSRPPDPSAAPRDWIPPQQEREWDFEGQPMASAQNFSLYDVRDRVEWVSGPKKRDAANVWTWLIALSPLWFSAAFAAPDWLNAALGADTITDLNRILLALVTWATLIAALVFDWSRLRRASFPQPVTWVLGVLLLPMYMILRAVRVHAAVRSGMRSMWLYLALQIGVITWAFLPVMSFEPAVPVLDGPGMEQHITETYLTDYGIEVSTVCPTDIPLDLGREFSCQTVLPDGSVEIIVATVTDADGSVTWIPESEMVPDTTA